MSREGANKAFARLSKQIAAQKNEMEYSDRIKDKNYNEMLARLDDLATRIACFREIDERNKSKK